ncbi:hypothetical protein HCH_04696 [Hahella chejuensis KCTC 2396]|uniref:Uncharacterized protein n=1 Tax=Hahella chejuensis (strain KCTC 2396) TaxID=349521 RepID=Q2SD80_HAHCH|nr:hypothetical protein HCH_04696 [Hahella chejuensis KCTC 2396]
MTEGSVFADKSGTSRFLFDRSANESRAKPRLYTFTREPAVLLTASFGT